MASEAARWWEISLVASQEQFNLQGRQTKHIPKR